MKSLGKMKVRFNLPTGSHIELDGRLMKFRGRARDHEQRLVFDGLDGVPADLTDAQLLGAQMDGRLRMVTELEAQDLLEERDRPRVVLAAACPEQCEETLLRFDYVRAWEGAGCPSRTEPSLRPIVVGEHERRREQAAIGGKKVEARAPSARQVLRWVAAWVNSGGDINALTPQRANSGNFEDKLHPTVREIVQRIVEEKYLVQTRPTVVTVHKRVLAEIREYNKALPEADHLPEPCLDTVYREVSQYDGYTMTYCREGKRAAERKWRAVMVSPRSSKHNETWEVDHTRVDLIVVDDVTGLPIGRPWVTVMIDRHSRMVVGFVIGFDAPSAQVVLECLKVAVLPKDGLLEAHPDIDGSWPCFGLPEVIVPDHGTEFRSATFKQACLTVGVDVQYTPVLKPWYKAIIERFFRTLSMDVFHRIPGTTFSNIFERDGDTPPELVAVATMGELRQHTLRYLVEVYSRRRHRGLLGRSPLGVFQESVERHGMRPMPDPQRLADALSLPFQRKPQPYGFEVLGLKYNDRQLLPALRAMPNRPSTFRLALDQDDLTRIAVLDPRDNRFKEVPVVPGQLALTRGTTLHQHRMALALQKSNPDAFAGDEGLARAHTVLDRGMEAKVGAKGAKNRIDAARYWDALTRAKPFTAGLFGDGPVGVEEDADEPVVAPKGPDHQEPAPPHRPDARAEEPAAERPVRRLRRPKAAAPAAEPAPPAVGVDDSLAAFARQFGMKVHKQGSDTDER